jgi:hypothetical protein
MSSPYPSQPDAGPTREQDQDPQAESGDEPGPAIPRTGEPEVDRALESLQGLESAPLDEHHDRLARVHEDLHRALNRQDQG